MDKAAVRSKAVVLMLFGSLLIVTPSVGVLVVVYFDVGNFIFILVCNHLDGEERAICFA